MAGSSQGGAGAKGAGGTLPVEGAVRYFVVVGAAPTPPAPPPSVGLPQDAAATPRAGAGAAADAATEPPPIPAVGSRLPVRVLQRYPPEDYEDFRLDPALPCFCFPRGGAAVVAAAEHAQPPPPTLHGFVLTKEAGDRCYGAALHLWERHPSGVVMVQKALAVIGSQPLWGAFHGFLCSLCGAALAGRAKERLVVSFVAETPLPPPGFTVSLGLPNSSQLVLRRPAPNQLPLLDLPVRLVFQQLKPPNVVLLVEALLLERRVILHSRCLSLLCTTGEVLMSLVWPLRPAAVYVPLLPNTLVDFCGCPMPFLLGIDSDMVRKAETMCEPHTIFVDIDQGTLRVTQDSSTAVCLDDAEHWRAGGHAIGPRPPPPERPHNKLLRRVALALEGVDFQSVEKNSSRFLPLPRKSPGAAVAAKAPRVGGSFLAQTQPSLRTRAASGSLLTSCVSESSDSTVTGIATTASTPDLHLLSPRTELGQSPMRDDSCNSEPLGGRWEQEWQATDWAFSPAHVFRRTGAEGTTDVAAAAEPAAVEGQPDALLRMAFIRFMTDLLVDHGKFVDRRFEQEFDQQGFLAQRPEADRPFLQELTSTQMWAMWVSRRLEPLSSEDSKDVLLFDEIIHQKLNRKTRTIRKWSTPFLSLDYAGQGDGGHRTHYTVPEPKTCPHEFRDGPEEVPVDSKGWFLDTRGFYEPRPMPNLYAALPLPAQARLRADSAGTATRDPLHPHGAAPLAWYVCHCWLLTWAAFLPEGPATAAQQWAKMDLCLAVLHRMGPCEQRSDCPPPHDYALSLLAAACARCGAARIDLARRLFAWMRARQLGAATHPRSTAVFFERFVQLCAFGGSAPGSGGGGSAAGSGVAHAGPGGQPSGLHRSGSGGSLEGNTGGGPGGVPAGLAPDPRAVAPVERVGRMAEVRLAEALSARPRVAPALAMLAGAARGGPPPGSGSSGGGGGGGPACCGPPAAVEVVGGCRATLRHSGRCPLCGERLLLEEVLAQWGRPVVEASVWRQGEARCPSCRKAAPVHLTVSASSTETEGGSWMLHEVLPTVQLLHPKRLAEVVLEQLGGDVAQRSSEPLSPERLATLVHRDPAVWANLLWHFRSQGLFAEHLLLASPAPPEHGGEEAAAEAAPVAAAHTADKDGLVEIATDDQCHPQPSEESMARVVEEHRLEVDRVAMQREDLLSHIARLLLQQPRPQQPQPPTPPPRVQCGHGLYERTLEVEAGAATAVEADPFPSSEEPPTPPARRPRQLSLGEDLEEVVVRLTSSEPSEEAAGTAGEDDDDGGLPLPPLEDSLATMAEGDEQESEDGGDEGDEGEESESESADAETESEEAQGEGEGALGQKRQDEEATEPDSTEEEEENSAAEATKVWEQQKSDPTDDEALPAEDEGSVTERLTAQLQAVSSRLRRVETRESTGAVVNEDVEALAGWLRHSGAEGADNLERVALENCGVSAEALRRARPSDERDFARKLLEGAYTGCGTSLPSRPRSGGGCRLEERFAEDLRAARQNLRGAHTRAGIVEPHAEDIERFAAIFAEANGCLDTIAALCGLSPRLLRRHPPQTAADFAHKLLRGAYMDVRDEGTSPLRRAQDRQPSSCGWAATTRSPSSAAAAVAKLYVETLTSAQPFEAGLCARRLFQGLHLGVDSVGSGTRSVPDAEISAKALLGRLYSGFFGALYAQRGGDLSRIAADLDLSPARLADNTPAGPEDFGAKLLAGAYQRRLPGKRKADAFAPAELELSPRAEQPERARLRPGEQLPFSPAVTEARDAAKEAIAQALLRSMAHLGAGVDASCDSSRKGGML